MEKQRSHSACIGCGAVLEQIEGPTHRYMLSSPACFALFTEVLAFEYSDPKLMQVHRLTVDAFAIQHPGKADNRQAIQSVGLHLARLGVQLGQLKTPKEANDIMLVLGKHKADLQYLAPPKKFSVTVSDVARLAGTPEHYDAVIRWAVSAWEDWRDHHAYITSWTERCMSRWGSEPPLHPATVKR